MGYYFKKFRIKIQQDLTKKNAHPSNCRLKQKRTRDKNFLKKSNK